MKLSQAKLQQLDTGVKVYNAIFGTNFKLVIRLYDNFYTCDFVRMQDNNLVFAYFLDKEIETRLVPLPKNTELQSLQNSLYKEFLGSFYTNSPVIKATYESFKTFPDVLLKKLVELLNNWDYLESNEAYSGYPYIYNLKNLETGFTLPFVELSQEDYNLVALYQCE